MELLRNPKEAKRLSSDVEAIIGVRFIDYSQSKMWCVFSSKPKIDDPKEMSLFSYRISANLVKIILWDKTKKEIISEIGIN
jgi:hypothetical protein